MLNALYVIAYMLLTIPLGLFAYGFMRMYVDIGNRAWLPEEIKLGPMLLAMLAAPLAIPFGVVFAGMKIFSFVTSASTWDLVLWRSKSARKEIDDKARYKLLHFMNRIMKR